MTDEYDDIDFRIARSLRELSDDQVERRRAELPISLWPLAFEHPDEGDIPSEVQPLRARAFGRWEEIDAIPKAPLGLGDTFSTRVYDGQRRFTNTVNTYRVLGRTPGSRHDWLVIEQLLPGPPRRTLDEPPPRRRPDLYMRYADDPGERRLIAEVGDSRWTLGVNAKRGRHVARGVPGTDAERHGYTRDEITRALVDEHMLRDEPLPNIREAEERHWRRAGERYREGLRRFAWTLSYESGAQLARGEILATSYRHALELATRDAFGDEPEDEPAEDTGTRRVWTNFSPATVLEVRRIT